MVTLGDYHILYYTVILVIYFFACLKIDKRYRSVGALLVIFLLLILAIIIGNRAEDIGTDTANYISMFDDIDRTIENRLPYKQNLVLAIITSPIYYLGMLLLSRLGFDSVVYLTINSLVMFTVTYSFCKRYVQGEGVGRALVLFCILALNFTTINQHFNILRTGVSYGFVCLSSYYLYKNQYRKTFIFTITAALIHVTSVIPFACFLFVRKIKLPLVTYYIIYAVSVVLSYIGVGFHNATQLLNLNYEKVDLYLGNNNFDYNVGFRPDFVVFNTFFLLIFIQLKKHSQFVHFYMKAYILLSSVFFFYFYIPFSDRIGLFSWSLIPLMLYDGVIKKYPNSKLASYLVICVVSIYSLILISRF